MRWLFLFFWSFCLQASFAQEYKKIVFDVDEGLITQLTKGLAFDSIGYLWIGTDEGLVRFDGLEFKSYLNATPSRYIKKLVKLDNQIYAISDLGITRIMSEIDTAYFVDFIAGGSSRDDSLLWYPKEMYRDQNGNLWISEPRDVVRFDTTASNPIVRYEFEEEDLSISFLDSFEFFEKGEQLFVVSHTGRLHLYNSDLDQFEFYLDLTEMNVGDVSSVLALDRRILLGHSKGIHELQLLSDTILVQETIFSGDNVSSLDKTPDGIVVGTYSNEAFILNEKDLQLLEVQSVFRMNDASYSEGGDLWLSTDEGVVLLQRNIYNVVNDQEEFYIENILPTTESIYYCYKDGIRKINRKGKLNISETVEEGSGHYYLSMVGEEQDFWISDKSTLKHYVNDQIIALYDLSDRGLFVFNLFKDSLQNIWLTQDNAQGVLRLSKNKTRTEYGAEKGVVSRVLIIRGSDQNDIYLGGVGQDAYLYKYNSKTDQFDNLSVSIPFEFSGILEVNDLVVANDTVWLASTAGVLYLADGQLQRLRLRNQQITTSPAKAITKNEDELWVSNSYGLYQISLKDGNITVFEEGSGLPSRSANPRNLVFDDSDRLWIGTAKGIAYSLDNIKAETKTKPPIVSSITINGVPCPVKELSNENIPYDVFLRLSFNSFSMPGNLIEYKYRLGENKEWISIGNKNSIEFNTTQQGRRKLQIRARKQGNYAWSDISNLEYSVMPPVYLQWWFILLVVLIAGLLFYAFYKVNQYRLRNLEKKMTKLVDERTDQLQKANKELTQINKELDMFVYSASHDLKAPLSSLTGLIDLFQMEKDEQIKKQLIVMMHTSISKLDTFIKEVIDYSKNSRIDVIYEKVEFQALISEILDSYRYMEHFDQIKFTVDVTNHKPYILDKNRVRIILNNLVSNAIRYCDMEKDQSSVHIRIYRKEGNAIIEIEDNGIGIPEEHKEKVYKMFYRASESKTGSGLGLYIVQESIKNLNGEIYMESEEFKGTTFTITLPMAKEGTTRLSPSGSVQHA